jgi:hypothetical protein
MFQIKKQQKEHNRTALTPFYAIIIIFTGYEML